MGFWILHLQSAPLRSGMGTELHWQPSSALCRVLQCVSAGSSTFPPRCRPVNSFLLSLLPSAQASPPSPSPSHSSSCPAISFLPTTVRFLHWVAFTCCLRFFNDHSFYFKETLRVFVWWLPAFQKRKIKSRSFKTTSKNMTWSCPILSAFRCTRMSFHNCNLHKCYFVSWNFFTSPNFVSPSVYGHSIISSMNGTMVV